MFGLIYIIRQPIFKIITRIIGLYTVMQVNILVLVIAYLALVSQTILDRQYYKTLKVPVSATQEEIKQAYRKLSRKYHPDRKPNYRDKFQKINVAYQVLSNQQKKYLYDRLGKQKMDDPNIQQQKNIHTLKGEDIQIKLTLRLEDLYSGKQIEGVFFKKTACPHCLGSGAQNQYDIVRCSQCNGQGKKTKKVHVGGGYYNMMQQTCHRCHGQGKIVGRKCQTCKGNKIINGGEQFKVNVAPGTNNYQRIVYLNMGDEKMQGAPGDLIITIHQAPHSTFVRYGDRLQTWINISLKEALFGFQRIVTQLDGRELIVKRQEITQPGQIIVLKGEGMPIKGTEQKSDMHVEVRVIIPEYQEQEITKLKQVFQQFNL